MEFHQIVALCIVIALAFVIDSTVKLQRYRRKNEIRGAALRDFRILRRPNEFPLQETRLAFRSWIACAAAVGFVVLYLAAAPPGVGPTDALSTAPAGAPAG
ncbi:MAG: hypothetical protein RIM80_12070 [Alphaproteobacteria bacterium]